MQKDLQNILESWGLNSSAINLLGSFGLNDLRDLEDATPSVIESKVVGLKKLQLVLYEQNWLQRFGPGTSAQEPASAQRWDIDTESGDLALPGGMAPTPAVDRNVTVDVMHDIFEGVAGYTMQVVLKGLIVRNRTFTLSKLNSIMEKFTFGPDEDFKPTKIRRGTSGSGNFVMRMSASEMRTFVTYFGVMVGHLVKPHDETEDEDDSGIDSPPQQRARIDDSSLFFYLYKLLSEIISIVCTDFVTRFHVAHLPLLVHEFLDLYRRMSVLVGAMSREDGLPPKFHMLTQYPRLLQQRDPLNAVPRVRPEEPVVLTGLRPVASIEDNTYRKILEEGVKLLRENFAIEEQIDIQHCDSVKTADSVSFSPEYVLCVGIQDGDPSFVEIIDFFCTVPQREIFFRAYDFETLYFSEHYRAYEVVYAGRQSFYRLDDFIDEFPFPNTVIEGRCGNTYVICRNSV